MATKTLILRPVKVTCDEESLLTFVPDTTTLDSAHLLINEEIADDDATYIECKTPVNIMYHFSYVKPADMKQIIGFNFYTRDAAILTGPTCSYTLFLNSDYVLSSIKHANNEKYEVRTVSFSETDESNIFKELNSSIDFHVTQATTSSGSKAMTINVTQVYVEIIYEPADIIYIKSNDIWDAKLYIEVYSKNNVEWVKLESPAESVFENNSKYKIKEVD